MDFKNCFLHALSEPGTFIAEAVKSCSEDLKTVSPESSTELPQLPVPNESSGEPSQLSAAASAKSSDKLIQPALNCVLLEPERHPELAWCPTQIQLASP